MELMFCLPLNSSQSWKSGLHIPFEGRFLCKKRKVEEEEEEGKVSKPIT